MHFYTFRPPAPTVRTGTADAERWSVGPTSHGVREGREGAARHRIADSTSGEHRAAAAEGASRGENRPLGHCELIDDMPMPTSMSPIGTMRSRTV